LRASYGVGNRRHTFLTVSAIILAFSIKADLGFSISLRASGSNSPVFLIKKEYLRKQIYKQGSNVIVNYLCVGKIGKPVVADLAIS
jgi:hypothetical protein